ncbi:hypothetical protein CI105_08075 [Candidatus Izimaplasma bacterium ZiA1]|uniref:helix-turn-helix domain-containing protein n=1 Tax=Candidatus Izimoplasma sp. ZiA1 TaxID=2024899 RepID=UPI000BAA47ED|nr:hypothetical protein CI105_08075 [Candidatus Izimaplasma bacterium ZiA1]
MEKNIISKRLVKLRTENGFTQKELSVKLNYSDKVISKWERGESFPNIIALKQLSKLYNISIDDLVSDELEDNSEKIETQELVVNRVSGPSLFVKLSILIPLAFTIFSISISIVAFLASAFVFGILMIVYSFVVAITTFEAEYKGHIIRVVNRPKSLYLYIDNRVVDVNKVLFAMYINLSGKIDDETIKVSMTANFFMNCSMVVE